MLTAIICGCSKQTPSTTEPVPTNNIQATFDSITISDSQVLTLAYSSYRFPDGFYQENLAGGSIYYENTLSILPVSQRSSHAFELSTNNQDQALAYPNQPQSTAHTIGRLCQKAKRKNIFSFVGCINRIQTMSYWIECINCRTSTGRCLIGSTRHDS